MKVVRGKYFIASKSFPLMFYDEGEAYSDIEDACLFDDKEICEYALSTYDEPEECQILKVLVTYEF